jgi:broad specificity phosphatase PhoE
LIIAVTHGGAIQCMVCRTVGHPLRDRDGIATPNCGIHRFTWDGSWHWRGVDGAADAIAVDGPPT